MKIAGSNLWPRLFHGRRWPRKRKNRPAPLERAAGSASLRSQRLRADSNTTTDEEISVSERMERPWALMRHHAGWADVFHIETESKDRKSVV